MQAQLQHRPALRPPGFRPRGLPLMSGKPPINRPAETPMPSMELSLVERAALTRIRNAGRAGVAIGDDLAVSTAIRLGLVGAVWIDKATPQRVRLTRFAP